MAKAAKKQRGEELDDEGYPTDPRNVTKTAWFYENSDGLLVVQQARDADNRHISTASITIPWKAIEAAVDHHRKTKKV